ncbi:MAG TPA: dihydroorotate dehydrogenase [Vicinamibacteria bacterium]|nr:dihydroorotate dehydrogenase [Vicinamibacteria bacterium]
MTSPSLGVRIGSLNLKNPLLAASGTCGYGVEIANVVDLNTLGGIVTKGLYMAARDGCDVPRIAETPAGLLNAIGLQGVGIRAFVEKVLPGLRAFDTAVIVNVCGETVEEYAEVSRIASEAEGVHALEINISCPNVKTGGIAFGTDPVMTHEVVAAVRKASALPVIPKLSPNVTDITVLARACEEAGADAISCVNTFLGLAIDVETRKPKLAFGTGGLSGPAIRPLAVRMTWQAARAVKIPIIGIGGIASASDALEFFIAGASAVQVGTMNFSRPNIYAEIEEGVVGYLTRHGLASIRDLVGTIKYPR